MPMLLVAQPPIEMGLKMKNMCLVDISRFEVLEVSALQIINISRIFSNSFCYVIICILISIKVNVKSLLVKSIIVYARHEKTREQKYDCFAHMPTPYL